MLWTCGKTEDCYQWLTELENRLLVRKYGLPHIPFIESRSRMDLVAEYAAKKTKPPDYSDRSSYLLLMILELCFSLPTQERNELIFRYVRRLVRGIGDNGETLRGNEIDLVGWAPPAKWAERVLGETVTDGTAITLMDFDSAMLSESSCVRAVEEHVTKSREKFPFKIPDDIPKAALVLGCIRHRSPLPSEFWRSVIFPLEAKPATSE
jgi:hypothetical protein